MLFCCHARSASAEHITFARSVFVSAFAADDDEDDDDDNDNDAHHVAACDGTSKFTPPVTTP